MSSIDDDKFQIVRRMDGNFFHKKPLYERIIIDRKTMKCTGMTFEDIEDATYQETYSYQRDPENSDNTIYNAYLYKSPGVLYWIRQKAHAWGVQKLNNIIEKDVKEERDKILFAIKERA